MAKSPWKSDGNGPIWVNSGKYLSPNESARANEAIEDELLFDPVGFMWRMEAIGVVESINDDWTEWRLTSKGTVKRG